MTIKEIIKKNEKAIFILGVSKPQKDGKSTITIGGTGYLVSSDGKFLTAYHVYNGVPEADFKHFYATVMAETNEKGISKFEKYPVKFISADKENDTVLMQIVSKKKFKNVCEIDPSDKIDQGENVFYFGFPLALEILTMGFGITTIANNSIISSVKRRGVDGSLHFLLINTNTHDGGSGAPLFSTETGKVIGMVTGRISNKKIINEEPIEFPAGVTICRPALYGKKLLHKNEK